MTKADFCSACEWRYDEREQEQKKFIISAWDAGLCEEDDPESPACYRRSEWDELEEQEKGE